MFLRARRIELIREANATTQITQWQALNWLIRRTARIEDKLNRLLEGELFIMSELSDAVDALEANTTAISEADASAEAAFTRLAQMIADLKTNATDPATAARIKALSDIVGQRAASLGAAVAAMPQ